MLDKYSTIITSQVTLIPAWGSDQIYKDIKLCNDVKKEVTLHYLLEKASTFSLIQKTHPKASKSRDT